jgi:molybdopterin synthase catalytic subunit
LIQLTLHPIDVASVIRFVQTDEAGAVNVFVGTVRQHTAARRVVRLEFEAYAPMALREMEKLATTAKQRWPVQRIAIHHRIGPLSVGEVAVVIAVATAHRQAAFEACQYAIDTLKQTVPIWKREVFEDGAVWVAAHP